MNRRVKLPRYEKFVAFVQGEADASTERVQKVHPTVPCLAGVWLRKVLIFQIPGAAHLVLS